MNQRYSRPLLILFVLFSSLMPCCLKSQPVQAQSGTPWEVLAEINGYRAANGLPPLVENQSLNIAAQNHVNWMAETGNYSHTGENGSTYTDRALAAGYGDGLSVRVTENWARGPQLTANGAVYDLWVPSTIHNSQMLTTFYQEFGAGVALDKDGMTVYVVNFGLVLGGKISTEPAQPSSTPAGPTNTPEPLVQPIITAEPNDDGSVIHIVQYGQTLWAIADAYDIPLQNLLAQNNLAEDAEIFPDQELLILPANLNFAETFTATSTPTIEPSPTPSPSQTPTKTASSSPTQVRTTPTAETRVESSFMVSFFGGNSLWIGIGLVILSLMGIALWFYTSVRLR